jgi:hypothetical protein
MSKFRVLKRAEDLFTVQEQKVDGGEWINRTNHDVLEEAKKDIEEFKNPTPETAKDDELQEVVYED